MKNKIDLYDTNKLKEAKKLITEVYEYNYKPHIALTRKLDTILRKIQDVIDNNQEE